MAGFCVCRALVISGNFGRMFTPPSPEVVAAAEGAFRMEALDLGRERAEVAADLRGDLQDPEARAAFVSEFAQAFADSFMEVAREERARIRGILSVPNASMLMPNGDGGMCHLRSDADGVVRSEKRQPRTPFAGRAL